ncbi:MAG: PQQ-dependent sugar dehydrogenase [Acidimicrobiia bacterium]
MTPRAGIVTSLLLALALVAAACGDSGGSPGGALADGTTADGTAGTGSDGTTADGTTGTTATTPDLAPLIGLDLEFITDDIPRPTGIMTAPGSDYLYFVDQLGTVRVFDTDFNNLPDRFINIRDIVKMGGIEQGLLGMAFHPDFATNGRFFVYYTDADGSRTLAEYGMLSMEPPIADTSTARILFVRPQPTTEPRHYGGMLKFGPDGYLWVSVGDGARASVNGQNPDNIFGTILRIDVDSGDPYGVPPDNPFVNGGGLPEVWAYGLRNPWRFDLDPADGLIYIADVGQERIEEVNVVSMTQGGYNFGWDILEASRCFRESGCDRTGLTDPIVEYTHDEGCSITGGVVYRGDAIPELNGHYFYADWCNGWVRSFRHVDGAATQTEDWTQDLFNAGQVQTFGFDSTGEMYIGNHEGLIYKVVPVRADS